MQRMLEDLLAAPTPVDYALTIDFDSMFTAAHVNRLLSLVIQTDFDAIAALQPKRSIGSVLGTSGKAESLVYTGLPLPVKYAHFGLTVIDLRKLERVPKPWFWAQPDANGEWGETKIDDDIWFWKQWNKAGNSLAIDPGCRLGHLEEMVSYFDESMNLKHVYTKHWAANSGSTVD